MLFLYFFNLVGSGLGNGGGFGKLDFQISEFSLKVSFLNGKLFGVVCLQLCQCPLQVDLCFSLHIYQLLLCQAELHLNVSELCL